MKGILKFLVLAVAGFALGAGAAWLQQPHGATPPNYPTVSVPAADNKKPDASTSTADDGVAAPEAAESKAAAELTAPAGETPADTHADNGGKAADAAKEEADTGPSAAAPAENVSPEIQKNLAAAKGEPPPANAGIGGAFSLTDHNGKPVTEKSWPDKYLLVFFGFTNCPDVCPVTLDKLTSVLNQLGEDAAKIQPLFITVDPARDKPHVLKEYVGHFHKSILGLTGTPEQVKAAEDAYKIYASQHDNKDGSGYSFDHSAFVYFMAPDGKMAEVVKTGDKASDIVDRIKPYLDGTKQPEGQTP